MFLYKLQKGMGFPGGSVINNPLANAGYIRDAGLILRLGRSLGGRKGNSIQYSCLGNSMDREAWWAPWGYKRVRHSLMTEQQQQPYGREYIAAIWSRKKNKKNKNQQEGQVRAPRGRAL